MHLDTPPRVHREARVPLTSPTPRCVPGCRSSHGLQGRIRGVRDTSDRPPAARPPGSTALQRPRWVSSLCRGSPTQHVPGHHGLRRAPGQTPPQHQEQGPRPLRRWPARGGQRVTRTSRSNHRFSPSLRAWGGSSWFQDGAHTWTPAAHTGDPGEAPGPQLRPGPALQPVGSEPADGQIISLPLCLTLPLQQINKPILNPAAASELQAQAATPPRPTGHRRGFCP